MRKLDNGHLTAADRATLNQQQNKLSNDIYKDKHDAQRRRTRIPRAKWDSGNAISRNALLRA